MEQSQKITHARETDRFLAAQLKTAEQVEKEARRVARAAKRGGDGIEDPR
jgi:hypothetical protein